MFRAVTNRETSEGIWTQLRESPEPRGHHRFSFQSFLFVHSFPPFIGAYDGRRDPAVVGPNEVPAPRRSHCSSEKPPPLHCETREGGGARQSWRRDRVAGRVGRPIVRFWGRAGRSRTKYGEGDFWRVDAGESDGSRKTKNQGFVKKTGFLKKKLIIWTCRIKKRGFRIK